MPDGAVVRGPRSGLRDAHGLRRRWAARLDDDDQARVLNAPGTARRQSIGTDTPRILLFDIDGTLVSTGGAGAVAWKQAFRELHGIPADIGRYTDAGMTDPDVGAKTFEAVLDRKPTPYELAQLLQRRLEHLPEAVSQSKKYRVLPGAPSGCDG